jgi:dihydrodipicolinate synthase/N-acetylneuraminate lyase
MLTGAIAAAVTPLSEDGDAIDERAFPALTSFLIDGGVDGALACGTTGEGVLLSVDERRRVTERFLEERRGAFQVAVHAGAQSTRDTVALATHAREVGADAVAVIAPPYYPLDDEELLAHLAAAAHACDPLPFYVYEFVGRSGYAIPVAVIERLRGDVSNLVGMKVSDTPWDKVTPYLIDGLDVFVGSEPLVPQGLDAGARGAVSGLATAFPEIVSALVHDRTDDAAKAVTLLRERLAGIPFQSALKTLLVARGIEISPAVRRPLRAITDEERETVLSAARDVGVDV